MSKTESAKFTASVKAATKHRLEKLAKISGRSISFLTLSKGRRRGGAERHAPQCAKLVEIKRPHAVDSGLDRPRAVFSIVSLAAIVWIVMAYKDAPYVATWGIPEWWKPIAIIRPWAIQFPAPG